MVRTLVCSFVFILLWSVDARPLTAQDRIRDLVVKIHAIHHTPDVLRPWMKNSPQQVGGSGVVIRGRRILTNAHVVRYASQIYVQPNQSPDRIAARVEAIAPSIDLAVLKLEDEAFFEGRGFLPFADELPRVKDVVNVYGYPTGGTELSVTQGIVSRIEFTEYYYQTSGLRIQVDAALNFGNSGGPAVSDGKLVGLVFSLIQNAQNIGYLIPVEEIELFLADIADGSYDGKPQIHDFLQTVENDALRRKLGLPPGINGIMVADSYSRDPSYPLREWDVITRIGDTPIDSDGKVTVRYDLRLSALYLVQKHARNGQLKVTVFREGRTLEIDLPVHGGRELVVPYLMNDNPRYFIAGPLVFSQATQEYIERVGVQRLLPARQHASLLITRRYDKPAFRGEELVVVASPMFPHRSTKGYDNPERSVVSEVNGVPVRNLRHLVEILRDSAAPDATFKFSTAGRRTHETMVFNRAELLASTAEILEENGIRHPHSPDLRSVWEKAIPDAPRAAAAGCCVSRP
ncbi:MAG TPA: trypsin-like peptidase domain-containing protein [candidate division Zixibacteria bacterium]|nr:trypsin-like peptidase domain-containing protein [candidate division Zixibacteria bacterium]